MNNEQKRNVGGGWIKTSKNGDKYMSLSIEIDGKKQFVMFKNKHKQEGSNHPDYVIFPSTPISAEHRKPVHPAVKAITDSFSDISDEEIPF